MEQNIGEGYRILALADLHYIDVLEWCILSGAVSYKPKAVIMLGDIGFDEARRIKRMAKGIPVLYVLGNHNLIDEYKDIDGLIPLDGRAAEISGVTFAGVSGGPRYKPDNTYVMREQEEVIDITTKLPTADVLITHESPWLLLGNSQSKCGFVGITNYLKRCSPLLHLFGHHHINIKTHTKKTIEICVFRCAVIDLEKLTSTVLF